MTDIQPSLLGIDNDISRLQNRLLTLPRPHPRRSLCLLILAITRLERYEFSDEGQDLDKSIYHSTEVILLPFDAPIALGSYVIEALFSLANPFFFAPSLETSNVTRSDIKASLVKALAVHVKLDSGVEESLLIDAVKALAYAIHYRTTVLSGHAPADGVEECLREARIRFPDLDAVRFALACSLSDRFIWAQTHDDDEEAMSILDEMIADPNEYVELAMHLAQTLALGRFAFDSKPEHLAEAIFRTRTLLNTMSSGHPERRTVMKQLADLEQTRFKEFGVRGGWQEDNAEVVNDSHLAASPQMVELNPVEFPLPMPDRRDP
ncbi:hypothetical protein BJV74DRAFT_948948 [Russula compacta]|nr:hypothetical protein BJV74DRAFT_948948 [Russula compacta]